MHSDTFIRLMTPKLHFQSAIALDVFTVNHSKLRGDMEDTSAMIGVKTVGTKKV